MQCKKCKSEIPDNSRYCLHCGASQAPVIRKKLKRPNGFGSVYKKSGRRSRPWVAAKGGEYIGFYTTKTEALEALERLSGKPVRETYNYTFKQVYEKWKPEHFLEIDESGKYQYERAFVIFEDLHDRKFRDLRTSDFQQILDRHRTKSKSTVGKYKQLITQMSQWAVKNEIIATDFAKFCSVNGKDAVHHQPMTPDEIQAIENDSSETARIVCMLLATGMRIGELFNLPLANYHGTYVVGGEKSEAGRERTIPIRPEGRRHFAYFAANSEGMKLLLDSYTGHHSVRAFRIHDYYPLLDRLGIDRSKTPHSTRTTYGTRAATEEEMAPATLQKVLGHKSFETTQKYYNRPSAVALVTAVERSAEKGKNKGTAKSENQN